MQILAVFITHSHLRINNTPVHRYGIRNVLLDGIYFWGGKVVSPVLTQVGVVILSRDKSQQSDWLLVFTVGK